MEKRKVILFALFACVSIISVSQTKSFMQVYNEAVSLNQSRFKNVDSIQVGDTVLFPAKSGDGVEFWVANEPNGATHDCIWRLTSRYMNNSLVTEPAEVIFTIPVSEDLEPEPVIVAKSFAWLWFLLLVLVIILLLLVLSFTIKGKIMPWDDGINRNPVIPGGLSDDANTALRQINSAYPSADKAVLIERGRIFGPENVQVEMLFSNRPSLVFLRSGQATSRVQRESGLVEYYRNHCGNLFGEISDGKYELPKTWHFVPDSGIINEPIVQPTKIEPLNLEKADVSEKPAEENFKSVIDLLKTVKEMNGISHFTYKDLSIDFQTHDESKE